ncbi:hypothetical protein [Bradyrhizobium sp. S3.5.5]|uniref:hypothetical protein n=1 Tax=Bradyrhizobium sp. S3.5.5 TaxID=3156430 RepID=UPI003399C204
MSHDEGRSNFKPTPIIKPYGVQLQITAGNKLKFITAVQNAPKKELSDLQKRLYIRMIDMTNEGYRGDSEKYGHSYPNFPTLAKECACTVSAAKNNIAALETGVMKGRNRADGTREADKIIPERWRIKVKRQGERGKGGAGHFNMYWLPLWNEFGAVDGGKKGPRETVHEDDRSETVHEKTVHRDSQTVREDSETVHGAHENGPRGGPDSPQILTSFTHLNNADSHFASLSDAGSFVDEADKHSISTSDCMSARQQFHFLKHVYERKFGRPVADNPVIEDDEDEDQVMVDGNWKAFLEASDRNHFTLALMNIKQAGPDHSFADCVSGKASMSEEVDVEEEPPF